MNMEKNWSTTEKGENKTHPAFLPRPPDTHRHLIPCTLLLQTPHIFNIFALAYRRTAPIFQQALCSCSQSTHSRALPRQKVGSICLVKSSCLGQAFSKKVSLEWLALLGPPCTKTVCILHCLDRKIPSISGFLPDHWNRSLCWSKSCPEHTTEMRFPCYAAPQLFFNPFLTMRFQKQLQSKRCFQLFFFFFFFFLEMKSLKGQQTTYGKAQTWNTYTYSRKIKPEKLNRLPLQPEEQCI